MVGIFQRCMGHSRWDANNFTDTVMRTAGIAVMESICINFFTKLGRQTQRRFASFADQLGERRAEAFACERAVSEMRAKLMTYSGESDDDMTDDESG